MTFTLTFKCDNAAFDDDILSEIHDILVRVKDKIATGHEFGPALDSNGNTVGKYELRK